MDNRVCKLFFGNEFVTEDRQTILEDNLNTFLAITWSQRVNTKCQTKKAPWEYHTPELTASSVIQSKRVQQHYILHTQVNRHIHVKVKHWNVTGS